MTTFLVATTRCECQAILTAKLNEQKQVIQGWASRQNKNECSPAHSIHPNQERFDIGWLCPFCNRNTMRSFNASALRIEVAQEPTQPT